MNKTIKLLAPIFTTLIATNAYANNVDLQITGLKSNKGKVYVQLFKGQENFNKGKAEASSVVNAKKGEVTVSFYGLEKEDYGIRYYHDENDNGKMETNLIGLPTEGYGFSNSAKPNFGPVSYEQIKFEVVSPRTTNSSEIIF